MHLWATEWQRSVVMPLVQNFQLCFESNVMHFLPLILFCIYSTLTSESNITTLSVVPFS